MRSEASQIDVKWLSSNRLHDDAIELNGVFGRDYWQKTIEVKTTPEVQINIKKQPKRPPGKPTQNAYIESFNGRFRDECLNEHEFLTLDEARAIIEEWRLDYNAHRPHAAPGGLTPDEFCRTLKPSLSYLSAV